MSFFDEASLVMIPSGYKDQKVYSVKPTDGTGDLTFSRASGATRVGPTGLIEAVRTNISFYSEQFDNGFWNKLGTGLTVTANNVISPNGTLTADTLNVSNNDNVLYASRSGVLAGNEYTFSIYAKGTGTFSMSIRLNSLTTTTETKTLTSQWQRFTVSVTNALPVTSVEFYLGLNTSSTYNVWGAQVETGPVATTYIATTAAEVSVGPVSGLPRLDYTNSTCPKLLLEPQRTNLLLFSEQLDNAAWTKNVATITANASVSPDGYTNADTLTESTFTSDSAFIYETLVVTPSTSYTTSVFVKQGAGRYVYLRNYYNAGNAYHTVVADTQTGTITQASVGSSIINASSSIEAYGNGWYRVRATQTSTVEIALFSIIGLSDTATPTVGSFGQITIASNAGRSASVWGCQVEAGSYATSYIPTLGASVTRVADAASKTGITSLIGQTEGTLFYDGFYGNEVNELYLFLQKESSSGVDDSIYIQQSSGAIALNVYSGATQQAFIIGGAPTLGQRIKIAAAYKANDFVLYVNGVQIGTDNSGAVPTCGFLQVGSYRATPTASNFIAAKGINQTLLFKTRLSNAQLAELTA